MSAKDMADLIEFARIEADSLDVAPWAEVLRHALDSGSVDRATAQWITTLYNTFDDYDQLPQVLSRCLAECGETRRMAARERRDLLDWASIGEQTMDFLAEIAAAR